MDQGGKHERDRLHAAQPTNQCLASASAPGQTLWKTLCTITVHGKEERLWLPNQPTGRDVVCPKCQQIKRAQERKQAKAVEAAMRQS